MPQPSPSQSAVSQPSIIQGGMGIGVSNWHLARTVSMAGHLGVVSATAVDSLLVRRLQDGDEGGHMRRAMAAFPIKGVAETILNKYFLPEGRGPGQKYALLPMYRQKISLARQQIAMMASFVEVHLAREGHDGHVGVNLLTKVQMPNLPSLYGAMLAGVGFVLMGAGIPKEIPGVLDAFSEHKAASLKLDVEDDATGATELLTFDPMEHWGDQQPVELTRPDFLAIIASNSLATMLSRKASGKVNGFVIEGPTAGGHNAPPRGTMTLSDEGEPVYGPRDEVDLAQMRELGVPFWLAGGAGSPEALTAALEAGAAGIQVGTLFAYSDESGLSPEYKRSVLESALSGEVKVHTDPLASPTGYPFKVVQWPGDPTGGRPEPRVRNCDLGYLRNAYRRPDGRLGYRCAAEPVADYIEKDGKLEDTTSRRCLCNALMADIDKPQVMADGDLEPPLVTSGDDLAAIARFLDGRTSYSALDVLAYLQGKVAAGQMVSESTA